MPLCFAIMPITTPPSLLDQYSGERAHFANVARYIFQPAAEAAGFEFRAPTSKSVELIQAEIIANLEAADLVLCDISTWNANVFFELGIRVALDRPVAMVKDHLTNTIPFDNSMVNTHTYDGRMDVWRVEETVATLADFLQRAKTQHQNALWKYFGITQRASRTDAGSPEGAKLDLLLAEVKSLREPTARHRATSPRTLLYDGNTASLHDALTFFDPKNITVDIRQVDYPDFDLIVTTGRPLSPKEMYAFSFLVRNSPARYRNVEFYSSFSSEHPYSTIDLETMEAA